LFAARGSNVAAPSRNPAALSAMTGERIARLPLDASIA